MSKFELHPRNFNQATTSSKTMIKPLKLIFVVSTALVFGAIDSTRYFQFNSINCSSSNKTLKMKCLMNKYTPNNSSISFWLDIRRKLYDVVVSIIVYMWKFSPNFNVEIFFYSSQLNFEFSHSATPSKYRSLVNLEKVKICEFFNGTNNNAKMKWILDLVHDYIPAGIIHSCPYYVTKENENLKAFKTSKLFSRAYWTLLI